jgi:hypothetical protein
MVAARMANMPHRTAFRRERFKRATILPVWLFRFGRRSPMPRDSTLTLSDVLRPTLSVACRACTRHRRYAVATLLEQHGDAKLTELLVTLADCPKAGYPRMYERCEAMYEGLVERLL